VNDEKCYTCGRSNPGLWGFAPLLRSLGNDFGFVPLVVYGCSFLYGAGLIVTMAMGRNVMAGGSLFGLLSADPVVNIALGESGAVPIFVYGMWWTVLSAGWLHGGALHILFNMMAFRQLAPAIADIYGGPRMVIIYTVSSACGFILSSCAGAYMPRIPILGGASFTLGASAAIFGLLGALMHYGRRGGSSIMRAQVTSYAVSMFIFGLIMPGIDNYAHAGGFLGGYLASAWLDPLKRPSVNHMVGAVACLVATALAIGASMIKVFPALLP
jgi:rhomboid protease GluP